MESFGGAGDTGNGLCSYFGDLPTVRKEQPAIGRCHTFRRARFASPSPGGAGYNARRRLRWTGNSGSSGSPAFSAGSPSSRTRISVEFILERLGCGYSEAQILESFPDITSEHIRAAQLYAAAALGTDAVLDLPSTS